MRQKWCASHTSQAALPALVYSPTHIKTIYLVHRRRLQSFSNIILHPVKTHISITCIYSQHSWNIHPLILYIPDIRRHKYPFLYARVVQTSFYLLALCIAKNATYTYHDLVETIGIKLFFLSGRHVMRGEIGQIATFISHQLTLVLTTFF